MKLLVLVLLAAMPAFVLGQIPTSGFRVPSGAEYGRGRVLVKVKSAYKEQFNQMVAGNREARTKNVAFFSVAPLAKPELVRQGAGRLGPRVSTSGIDISQYFSLRFDPGQDLEEFINRLYSTGYFELVEPDYTYQMVYTPNDPLVNSQYYLNSIKAFGAWDITHGDSSITIAIVDSGGQLSHPDLAPNLYTNWKEYPPNGVDDDGNGFIDDYRGWDFIGADTLNLGNPSFAGDNNPAVVNGGLLGHGTWVSGCASGATDNGQGIAGVGFKTRLMFTKQTADNQNPNLGAIYSGYSGLLYAANVGIKIINLSWGGIGRSQIYQDIITHITVDLGCIIIAAAGNNGNTTSFYPASYDHVLSVAAVDSHDAKAYFSNFGPSVDVSAPGVGIETTSFGSTYSSVDGTSFSSPITAGAAALVWAKNPGFTGLQVAEQLRVTANDLALYQANPTMVNKLGKGRLDIHAALTKTSPSVRASHPAIVNSTDGSGKASLSLDFTNYLESTSGGLQISVAASGITFTKSTINPGAIGGGVTYSSKLNPFEFVTTNVPDNTTATLLITYSDGTYSDYQNIDITINPTFININTNKIGTTITDAGRTGFQDPANSAMGQGLVFNQQELLFEMGLIMGTSPGQLLNNVRGINNTFVQDFLSVTKIKETTPGKRSSSEVTGSFSNSLLPANQTISIDYASLTWKDSPYDKFVILEYRIKNVAPSPVSNFYFGLFADWDITPAVDAADWYDQEKLGYVFSPVVSTAPYAGVQLLTGPPSYYAIENDQTIPNNPFGLYDGFTDVEKFQTISTSRLSAGLETGHGADVSHVVSSGPYNLDPGNEITIAFALHAASNLDDLKSSAVWADSVYNYTLQAPPPLADSAATCYGSTATLNASGASTLKWYQTATGGQSFFTGPQITTGTLLHDTTLFVSNADHSYESVRTPVVVSARANPTISASGSPVFCEGNSLQLSVGKADSILWNTGDKTPAIMVTAAGNYFVTVKDTTLHCQSVSQTIAVVVNSNPTADYLISGSLNTSQILTFSDQSSGAVLWTWDFGDGTTSELQNPQHAYGKMKDYVVNLTVTNDQGCRASKSSSISIVTGLVEEGPLRLDVFPNPATGAVVNLEIEGENLTEATVSLMNAQGQRVADQILSFVGTTAKSSLPISGLSKGLYLLKVKVGEQEVIRKIVKVE